MEWVFIGCLQNAYGKTVSMFSFFSNFVSAKHSNLVRINLANFYQKMTDSKMQKVQEQLEAYRRRKQAEEEANKPKEVPASETDSQNAQQEPKLNKFDYFAIDVLNIYPMRKWREWSAADPHRCWAATGCFWLAGQILAGHAQFGIVYFMLSLFAFVFLNLGSRKEGELSAYSVFNPNCERLLGQMTAEQFERDMMIRRNNENE